MLHNISNSNLLCNICLSKEFNIDNNKSQGFLSPLKTELKHLSYKMLHLFSFFFPLSEMHRHVHGQIYGRLEHRVPNIQLQAAERTSSNVKELQNTLPPSLCRIAAAIMRTSTVPHWSRCTTSAAQHPLVCHHHRQMRPVDTDP